MEAIYSRELGIKALENANTAQTGDYKLSSALKLYHRFKGVGHQYGKGYSLGVKAHWMHKLTKS